MPPRAAPRGPDTIRILVATDSHVGYNERDSTRKDDSWKTFHEVMCLAKEHDVDMVLHGGDLFHENKPSRKSMYNVMRSLRMNCLGDKPCELDMLSDASENFGGLFDHVNYEDPDINVAIPVFAVHGNHDDPSGEGSFSALDLLQVSGLVNYYGRSMESDKVEVKPVLLQKGRTKLALFGLSNVRDERLFRTFRDGGVKFFQPGTQKDEWFNLMTVHQNHHAYTETGYLPENFLPEFIDLVVWGHEHECLIEPRFNPEMGFHVMQPGSSIATSLMPGEAVPKHVAIVSVTGKEFTSEPIRLKSVRPFVMKEIVLADEPAIKDRELWRMTENRSKITQHLISVVDQLIEDAKREWLELQDERDDEEEIDVPLPLVRLRVEYTAPEPGAFNIENPQRFSNRFVDKVANTNDVVQFYRKKKIINRALKNNAELPDEAVMAQLSLDTVRVERLVKEFLMAQSLTLLPQNGFGDAVAQFVDKDDKHAMEMFVNESLADHLKEVLRSTELDEEDFTTAMEEHRTVLEERFTAGHGKKIRKTKLKPKPDEWDSDMDGEWADSVGAIMVVDDEEDGDGNGDDLAALPAKKPVASARGRGKAAATTRTPAAPKKSPAAKAARGRKKVIVVEEEEDDSDEDEDGDVNMDDDDDVDDDDEEALFVKPSRSATRKPAPKPSARAKSPVKKAPPKSVAKAPVKQSTLNFSQSSTRRNQPARAPPSRKKVQEPSDDDISDDDDAFEPVSTSRSARSRR
ncbi:DNA repair exonuclease [Pleomassaria siparia CBS 279.74]|uniref:Double-strand break repair protein n=1 Tax=Pleomassaria siparia CBS 279.74 TaxID=1314801 RepID=A0A6G1K1Q7_9PLEO|nr:DNA repair exonuclease [Pleomassaria siparia CBS 279.74]